VARDVAALLDALRGEGGAMTSNTVRVRADRAAELAELLAGLTQHGVVFNVELRGDHWEVEITGC